MVFGSWRVNGDMVFVIVNLDVVELICLVFLVFCIFGVEGYIEIYKICESIYSFRGWKYWFLKFYFFISFRWVVFRNILSIVFVVNRFFYYYIYIFCVLWWVKFVVFEWSNFLFKCSYNFFLCIFWRINVCFLRKVVCVNSFFVWMWLIIVVIVLNFKGCSVFENDMYYFF